MEGEPLGVRIFGYKVDINPGVSYYQVRTQNHQFPKFHPHHYEILKPRPSTLSCYISSLPPRHQDKERQRRSSLRRFTVQQFPVAESVIRALQSSERSINRTIRRPRRGQ